jgi:ABC-type phosphate transport system substrate-binding protein
MRRREVLDFFTCALRHGQALARDLDYVPIPDDAAARIVARLNAPGR